MRGINSIELKYIINELKSLKGNRVENIYHSDNEVRIIIGENELVFSPSRLHLTKFPGIREMSTFAFLLRKYLKNKTVGRIRQHNMVIEMEVNGNILILELFPVFNCILCDDLYKIIMPMVFVKEERKVVPGERFIFPEGPDFKNKENFRRFISNDQIVAFSLKEYFGKYLKFLPKEITEKVGMELSEEDVDKILGEIRNLISKECKPVVYKDRKIIAVFPFHIDSYENLGKKDFETFNEALDFFFRKIEKENKIKKKEKNKRKKLKRRKMKRRQKKKR